MPGAGGGGPLAFLVLVVEALLPFARCWWWRALAFLPVFGGGGALAFARGWRWRSSCLLPGAGGGGALPFCQGLAVEELLPFARG